MKRVYSILIMVTVVVATLALALLLADTSKPLFAVALVALIAGELYTIAASFVFAEVKHGDRNNLIPALVAAPLTLVAPILHIIFGLSATAFYVLLVVGWAVALVALLFALMQNRAEIEQSEENEGPSNFTSQRSKA